MIAFVALAGPLERSVGTFQMLNLVYVLSTVSSLLYIAMTYLYDSVTNENTFSNCVAGISGLLFAILTHDCYSRGDEGFRVYGQISIKPKAFPWIFLLFTQLIFWDASFFGHLAGLLTGILCKLLETIDALGFLNFCKLPDSWIAFLEGANSLKLVTKRKCFASSNAVGLPMHSASYDAAEETIFTTSPQLKASSRPASPIRSAPSSPSRFPGQGHSLQDSDGALNEDELMKEAEALLKKNKK